MWHFLAQKELGVAQSFQAVIAMLARVSHQKHKETGHWDLLTPAFTGSTSPTRNSCKVIEAAQAHEVSYEESL